MASTSKAQQHLFGAALGGAKFPMARKLRQTMSKTQLRDFAGTKSRNLPSRIKPPRTRAAKGTPHGVLKDPPTTVGRLYPSDGK